MPDLQYSTAFHNKSAAAFYKHVQNFVQSPPSNTVNPNFPFESLINCMANRLGSHVKMDGSAGVKAAWKYNQAISSCMWSVKIMNRTVTFFSCCLNLFPKDTRMKDKGKGIFPLLSFSQVSDRESYVSGCHLTVGEASSKRNERKRRKINLKTRIS